MTDFTFDFDTFSDLYKDVNGFRPRGHEFYDADTTDERRQEIWDFYCQQLDEELERQKAEQAEAVVHFEAKLEELIALGAGDRENALRWLRDAQSESDRRYGNEYLEYFYNLPFGYIDGVRPGFLEEAA